MLSRRTAVAVPDTDLLNDKECTVTPAIADRSEGAAPPQRRTKCRLSLCIFSFFPHFLRGNMLISSNVTGLKGISGEDIPRCGHVELNLRRCQDVVQAGAEVADIEHGIIATDAIVKRGSGVLHSPAGHWIVDGTLEPPSQTAAIKLRTHQANYFLEFDEILKQGETDRDATVAAVRRVYRARHPPEASQGTLRKTMEPESDEQMTLPTRALKSPGQPSFEEKTAHEVHHLPYRPCCPECVSQTACVG